MKQRNKIWQLNQTKFFDLSFNIHLHFLRDSLLTGTAKPRIQELFNTQRFPSNFNSPPVIRLFLQSI